MPDANTRHFIVTAQGNGGKAVQPLPKGQPKLLGCLFSKKLHFAFTKVHLLVGLISIHDRKSGRD
jgi:hypothetical protein